MKMSDRERELLIQISGVTFLPFRCQFHQHFTCAVFYSKARFLRQKFVQKRFAQLCNFWRQNFVRKTRPKNVDEIDHSLTLSQQGVNLINIL